MGRNPARPRPYPHCTAKEGSRTWGRLSLAQFEQRAVLRTELFGAGGSFQPRYTELMEYDECQIAQWAKLMTRHVLYLSTPSLAVCSAAILLLIISGSMLGRSQATCLAFWQNA